MSKGLQFLLMSFLLLALIFFSRSGFAKEVRYKELPLEIKETDRLVIAIPRGSVKLIAAAPGKSVIRARKSVPDRAPAEVMSRFDQVIYNVTREDSVVKISLKGPESKADWADYLQPSRPEVHLEIEIPSVPAEVAVRDGRIEVQNWKHNLSLAVVDGALKLNQNEGVLRTYIEKGDLKIDTHKGRVEIETYSAKVAVNGIEGDIHMNNFSGDSSFQTAKGSMQIRTYTGGTTIAKSSGGVDFDLLRGGLSVQGFEGPVRGQSEEGNVSAVVTGEPDVHVETTQGNVSVQLPAASGASVRVSSEEGNLVVPDSMKLNRSANQKAASGRLGGATKGTVVVRSKTGTVRLK